MSRRIRWRWTWMVAGLLLCGGLTVGAAFMPAWMEWEHRFYEVKAGVLYRSAQLDPRDMQELIERYGLKTIINLRPEYSFALAGLSEEQWLRERGLRYVFLPCERQVDTAAIHQFLQIVTDPKSQPVLVHCHHGRLRTGIFSAAYRVWVEGWKAEDAAEEMERLGAPEGLCERTLPLLRGLESCGRQANSCAGPSVMLFLSPGS